MKFVDDQWGPVGSFNWLATHGTSMSRTNELISGDNKGAAARFMEDWFEKSGVRSILADEYRREGIPRRISDIISDHPAIRKCFIIFHLVTHTHTTHTQTHMKFCSLSIMLSRISSLITSTIRKGKFLFKIIF